MLTGDCSKQMPVNIAQTVYTTTQDFRATSFLQTKRDVKFCFDATRRDLFRRDAFEKDTCVVVHE